MALPDISNHKKLLEALKRNDQQPFDPRNSPPATLSERAIQRAEKVRPSTVVNEQQATVHAYDKPREWRQ